MVGTDGYDAIAEVRSPTVFEIVTVYAGHD
jgi:hypothetical protein